jgi:sporulation protein YlmC with PRC-barrel domain
MDQPATGATATGPGAPAEQATGAATATADAGKPVSTDDMMGRQVEGSDGQPLGRVSDVIVDPQSGRIQQLVIASGGFLGIGAKRVAVDFSEVEVRPEGGIVAKGLTQASIEGMPEFNVTAETAPLDPRPELPATTGGAAGGGIATPGAAGGGLGAGGATAPAPGQ